MNVLEKNLIIISIDNLRADCIACNFRKDNLIKYNLKNKIKTDTLDRFVREGIFFNNCISTAPYTTNAHASFLTGFWPYHHGIIDFFGSRLEKPTIFNILKEHGYKTLWQTDFSFLLGETLGFSQEIDKFVAGDEKESLAWLRENKENNFAAFFHFANVHDPYGFVDVKNSGDDYRIKVNELLKKYNLEPETKALPGQHYLLNNEFTEEDLLLKQNYRQVIKYLYENKLYGEIMDLYIEGLNYFDKNRFKNFIENLEKLNILQNSIIVIIGDHGEAWDEHNQGHNKGDGQDALSEEMLRVPMIIWQANKTGNLKIDKQVRSIDLVPTCLSLLDIENYKFDGTDLSDFMDISEDLPAFSQLWETDSALVTIFMNKVRKKREFGKPDFSSVLRSASMRQSGFTLSDYHLPNSKNVKSKFLFANKPIMNLGEEGEIFDVMRRRLDEYNKRTEDKIKKKQGEIQESDREKIAEQLRAIGYNV
jgi:membrane-anchored protein YejM (alkaline phosphatase superfamily)